MTEIYCIVECGITYNNGKKEVWKVTFSEISIGLASVEQLSVLKYLAQNLRDVYRIEVLDILYFQTEKEYQKYLDTTR